MKAQDQDGGPAESGETMDEGMHQVPADTGAKASENCVPLEALAMPGQDEKLNTPDVGDPVSYQVEGKVTRIEGDMAYVAPETVNGKPVTVEAAKTNDTPEDQDRAELYDMARARDEEANPGAGQTGAVGGMGGMA
ncbi:MAG: hypothetical protein KGL39_21315 [Patescibacteria group bacterium]|nr:hypothetical protein [Patescibacteria group bacterium]